MPQPLGNVDSAVAVVVAADVKSLTTRARSLDWRKATESRVKI